MKRSILLTIIVLFFAISTNVKAQSCFNIAAGNDTSISCLQFCLDLKARIPDIRSTETYSVVSIPYAPYAYTTPGGTTDPAVNSDDHFSQSFNLPFPFCFYGNSYDKLCVGSNGVLTFDITTNANTEEGYFMRPGNQIWYTGGTSNTAATFYAPQASIFLAYYDMNPATSPAGSKIEWRVEGSAPCRRFVVSFYRVGFYDNGICSNNFPQNLCTMQAVLYEGSGIIDVFYENKPTCAGAQDGALAIAGLQNFNRDQAVVLPGKNGTVWTAVNEGYRYIPSGTTSLLDSVSLYKNGQWFATGTTTSLGNGELEATFSPVCQPEDSMSYAVRAFYKQCDNSAVQTEGSDTIIVFKTLNPLNVKTTDALCNGANGTITVNSPLGANIEYSIDNGTTWQTSPLFNAPANTYTVLARVIGSLCGGSTTATIAEPTVLSATSMPTVSDCSNSTGTITITPVGGTPGYEYSIDNGVTYQPSNQFISLAVGTYNNIKIRDANGCVKTISETVALLDTMNLELGADSTICFGSSIILIPQTNALTDTFKWTPKATLNYDTIKTPIATPSDTTKYYLTAKWGICSRTDSITVNVKHKPVANAGTDTTVCYKTNATLFGSASNLSGTVNYAWSPPDSLTNPNSAVTGVRVDTTRQFTLTVTDNYGCNFSVTDSVIVFMQPQLVAFAGNDTNAIINRDHQLQATGRNAVDFVWSPAGPLNNPFIANPLAVLNRNTFFFVHITDAIGCTDDDTIFIKVYEGPTYYLPNAFTPDGNNHNDIFFPTPVGIRSTDYFRVFDRYGKLMYETRQWMQGWDGTLKGKPAASGTYVWMIKGIDKNGSVIEMKGTVILLR